MLAEIRQFDVRATGTFSRKPSTVTAETLTIGRGTDQLIQINCRQLSLQHCTIVRHSDGQIEVTSAAAMSVNRRSCRHQMLRNGDVIRIAGAEIVVTIPTQQDAASRYAISLEVRHLEQPNATTRATVKATQFEQTWLRKRPFAWLMVLLIISGALFLPYLTSFGIPEAWIKAAPSEAQASVSSWSKAIRDSQWLPDHAIWNSGPLADAHQHLADQCDSCHTGPFEGTPAAACMDCHLTTGVHSNKPEAGFQVADDLSCNACHADHNGGGLIRASQTSCLDCHRNISAASLGMSELPDVSNFDVSHPEFSVPIYRHENNQWNAVKRPLGLAGSTEQSGLRFSHQYHLEQAGRQLAANGKDLLCGDCHQPDRNGGFTDIVMEEQCQSCHTLSFDTDVPERQAPHKPIQQVINDIDSWYLRKQLRGGFLTSSAKSTRPGQSPLPTKRLDASEHALKVASSLIERESCVLCHQITQPNAPLAQRGIAAVMIQPHWLKAGSFDHAQHSNQECTDCHSAESSRQSEDILIPSIETCQRCHIGVGSDMKLENHQRQNSCLDCHNYHQSPPISLDANVAVP